MQSADLAALIKRMTAAEIDAAQILTVVLGSLESDNPSASEPPTVPKAKPRKKRSTKAEMQARKANGSDMAGAALPGGQADF